MTIPSEKKCRDCGQTKLASEFYLNGNKPPGLQPYCKPCHKARTYVWREANWAAKRRIERRSQLRKLYGIDDEQYEALLVAQDGRCAICGVEQHDSRGQRLAVDHCRDSGQVRGLLCSNCNNGLGRFLHDRELLLRAGEYLADPPAGRSNGHAGVEKLVRPLRGPG